MQPIFDNVNKVIGYIEQQGDTHNVFSAATQFVGYSTADGTFKYDGVRVANSPDLCSILLADADRS